MAVVDLSAAQFPSWSGTSYDPSTGRVVSTSYVDFAPTDVVLDPAQSYEFEFDVQVAADYSSTFWPWVDIYDWPANGDENATQTHLGGADLPPVTAGSAITLRARIGPGIEDWDTKTGPRVEFELDRGLQLTAVRWGAVDLSRTTSSDGLLSMQWGPALNVNLLSGSPDLSGDYSFGAQMVKISDTVVVVVLETGSHQHTWALRANPDLTWTPGPRHTFFNTADDTTGPYAGPGEGDPGDPALAGYTEHSSYFSETSALIPLAGSRYVHLGDPDNIDPNNIYFASVYQVDETALTITREAMLTRPNSVGGDAYYWQAPAAAWRGDRFVISDGTYASAPRIQLGSAATGYLGELNPVPHPASEGDAVTVGDTLVYFTNRFNAYTDTDYHPIMINFFTLGDGGQFTHRSEIQIDGMGGVCGGDFPSVFGAAVAGKVLLVGQDPSDEHLTTVGTTEATGWSYRGHVVGVWIDPVTQTASAPFYLTDNPYVAAVAGRTSLYNSAYVRTRSVTPLVDGKGAMVTWIESSYSGAESAVQMALVYEGQPVRHLEVHGMPTDTRSTPTWSWNQGIPLTATRFAVLALGPLFASGYGARLIVGEIGNAAIDGNLADSRRRFM